MSKLYFGIENNQNIICPHNKLHSVVYNDEPIRLNEISHLKKLGEEATPQPECKECRHSVCTCIWTKMNKSRRSCNVPRPRTKTKHISRDMQPSRHLAIEDAFLHKMKEKPKLYKNMSRYSLANSQSVHWILKPCRMRSSNANINSLLTRSTNANCNQINDQQYRSIAYKRNSTERRSYIPKHKKSFVYLVQDPAKGSRTQVKQKQNPTTDAVHQNFNIKTISNTLVIGNENIDIYTKNTKNIFNERKRKLLGIVNNKYYNSNDTSSRCREEIDRNTSRKSRSRSTFHTWLDNLIDKAKRSRDESSHSKPRRKHTCQCPEMSIDEKKYELFLQNLGTEFRCPPQMNRIVVKDQHVDSNRELMISASTTAQASGSSHRLKDFRPFKGFLQNKPRYQIQTLKVSQVEDSPVDKNLKGLSTYEVEIALSKIDNEKLTKNKNNLKRNSKKRVTKHKNTKKPKRNKLKSPKSNAPIKEIEMKVTKQQPIEVSAPSKDSIASSPHNMPMEQACTDPGELNKNKDILTTPELTNAIATSFPAQEMPVIQNTQMLGNFYEEPMTIKRLPVIEESSLLSNISELQRIKEKLQIYIEMEQAKRDADAEAVCNLVNSATNPMSSKLNTSSTITEQDTEQHMKTENFLEAPIRKCIKEFSATILKKRLKSFIKEKECQMDASHIRNEICNLIPKTNLSIATLRNKDFTISFHAPVNMRYRTCGPCVKNVNRLN